MLFEAIYFDGKSAVAHKVSGTFQEARREISFNHNDKILRILLDYDCTFEHINDELTIHVNDSAAQLIINDTELIKKIGRQKSQSWNTNLYHKLIDGGMRLHVFIVLLILGLIIFVNFYVLPAAAEKAVVLVPDSYDIQLGNTFFNNYKKYNDVNEEKSVLAQKFVDELELNSTKEIKVDIVESYEINAFALPNGQIVIFSGIIEEMESYEELAALLGHEIAHIDKRHSTRMMCRNLASVIFISVALSDVNSIMAIIADNANELQNLSFSRELEAEADKSGIDLMQQNNIDPQGMADLFSRLNSDDADFIPEFLSSHPVTTKRIENVEKLIGEYNSPYTVNHTLKSLFEKIKKTDSFE